MHHETWRSRAAGQVPGAWKYLWAHLISPSVQLQKAPLSSISCQHNLHGVSKMEVIGRLFPILEGRREGFRKLQEQIASKGRTVLLKVSTDLQERETGFGDVGKHCSPQATSPLPIRYFSRLFGSMTWGMITQWNRSESGLLAVWLGVICFHVVQELHFNLTPIFAQSVGTLCFGGPEWFSRRWKGCFKGDGSH